MKFINSMASRKFIVLVLGSVFFCMHLLDQNGWLLVAGAYLGINILDKFIGGRK